MDKKVSDGLKIFEAFDLKTDDIGDVLEFNKWIEASVGKTFSPL